MISRNNSQVLLLLWIVCCFLTTTTAFVQAADIGQPGREKSFETIKIESVFIPEDCTRKAKHGEKVSIHYIGTHMIMI